jgi:hypothetical protein
MARDGLTLGQLLTLPREMEGETPLAIYVSLRVKDAGLEHERIRRILRRWTRLHMFSNGGVVDEEKFAAVVADLKGRESGFDPVLHGRVRAATSGVSFPYDGPGFERPEPSPQVCRPSAREPHLNLVRRTRPKKRGDPDSESDPPLVHPRSAP